MGARLRDRGYPAPRFGAIGHVPGLVFWIQERLPGSVLDRGWQEPDAAALARLLPGLLRLNDAQAGLATGPRRWRSLITQTLTSGGDGYCLHSTLQAGPQARDLLPVLRRIADTCGPAIPDGQDFVHYDFTPANLLSDGTAVTGVIDINPPSWPVTAPSTWRPCCSTTTITAQSATHSVPGSWTWPGPGRPAHTWRTWCCGKSTGRCAIILRPPPPSGTCAWPEQSSATSTTARHTELFHPDNHRPPPSGLAMTCRFISCLRPG